MSCPFGFSLVGTNCYRDCADGYTANGDICVPNCLYGIDTGSACQKQYYTRTDMGMAGCPPNTLQIPSQTNPQKMWPGSNPPIPLEYCFPICPVPSLQHYAPDDSGTCVANDCPYIDNVNPPTRFPEVEPIYKTCSRHAYKIDRSYAFGACSKNSVNVSKFISFFNTNSGRTEFYTNVDDAINGYDPTLNINNINPNNDKNSYLYKRWQTLFTCKSPCPDSSYIRIDEFDTQIPNTLNPIYNDINYCLYKPNPIDPNHPPFFFDAEVEIPNICDVSRSLFGEPTTIPDAVTPTSPGYTGEYEPTRIKITASKGIFDSNINYSVGDIVATFQDTDPNSSNYLKYKGPFFKIIDPTKKNLGLPPYIPSNLYYADPNYINFNDFATSQEIGTQYFYNNLRPAGENNLYRNLCTIDNDGNNIYCAPTCATICPKGNASNVGLYEPYFETGNPQIWLSTNSYLTNDVVIYNGIFYKAIQNSLNQVPFNNVTYWMMFDIWQTGINYSVGNVVAFNTANGQQLYFCLLPHVSTNDTSPINSVNYWDSYYNVITNSSCYLRCGSSTIYQGDGDLCRIQTNKVNTQTTFAYSYCSNGSLPLQTKPSAPDSSHCYTLCPEGTTLKIPETFPTDYSDPLWNDPTLFRICATKCINNESFQDNGDSCAKISYTRVQNTETITNAIQSSINTNLKSNATTVSKFAFSGGSDTLVTIIIVIAGISFFILFVLYSQRLYLEKIN